MRFIIMLLNTILLFSILTVVSSCNGQSKSPTDNDHLNDPNSTIAKGDTVKEPGNNLMNIMQDKNNNYWFGSNGEGVYRYDARLNDAVGQGKTIIHFTTKDGLCDNQIRGIQEDNSGNIYFNTGGGISKFDGQTFTTLSIAESNHSNSEWKIQPGDLWFQGAQDSGVVYRYDGKSLYRLEFPKTKPAEEFISKHPRSKYPTMTFSPYDVYSIYRDSKGNVWFGTGMLGVCCYDGKSFTWISEDELEFGDLAFGIRSIIEDKDGKFWFSNTLHRYDVYQNDPAGKGKSLINFRKEKGVGNSKEYNEGDFTYFMSITEDNNGELWMATHGAGVWRYDGENMTHYPVKDGNTNITLFSIYKDKQGGLWLGTHEAGAYKFNGKTFERFKP